ncbi:MAG: prepilin-type N-terminal cleavage/methylation domain-containing protein [Candidatus Ratteibacteria bacterium]
MKSTLYLQKPLKENNILKNLFLRCNNDKKGLSLVEVLVTMVILVIVFIAGLLIFSNITVRISRQSAEKTVSSRASDFTLFLRHKLKEAIVQDIPGPFRIDFIGTETSIKFVAPYTEGNGSDLGKYGIYLDDNTIKMSFERIDIHTKTYTFEDSFTGSQPVMENVKFLSFSYWDGKHWQKTWNTQDISKLPEKIKVFFILYGGRIEGKRIEKGFSEEIWMGK